jgi:hypothetical protein
MSFKFDFDPKAFERAIRKDVEAHVGDMSREMTREFDRLRAQYAGRPVAEIKPALKRVWERGGGSLSDPELTEYAQLISDGTRIEFQSGPIKW